MSQRIKVFGLALMAALALSAVMVSAASAQFTSNKEHTIYSGSQKTGTNDVFTAGEGFGGISCETATVSGTGLSTNDADLILSLATGGCKDSFGRTSHIHCEQCNLKETWTGRTHVIDGKVKTITSGGGSTVCTVSIQASQTNEGVTYNNLGGTSGVEVTLHLDDVISTTSGGFFNCGVANGEHKNGTYDGVWIITGKDTSGAAASISVD